MVVGDLGLGSCRLGWGFQLMGFRVCGVGSSGFFGVLGSLYKRRKINLGETCSKQIGQVDLGSGKTD